MSASRSSVRLSFPSHELPAYRRRLQAGQLIYTTRVAAQVGRYALGQVYPSRLGELRVVSRQTYHQLTDHPFYSELTATQRRQIARYLDERGYEVIGLTAVRHPATHD